MADEPQSDLPADPGDRPPDIWEPWMRKAWRLTFVEALRGTGNRSGACRAAGISRAQLYRDLQEDEGFRDAVADAMEEAADLLERVAWQRATVGTPITSTRTVTDVGGNVVSVETTETTKISDTLLIFILKAARPQKFRENVQVQHTGEGGVGPVKIKVERERSMERLGELLDIAADLNWTPSPPIEQPLSIEEGPPPEE